MVTFLYYESMEKVGTLNLNVRLSGALKQHVQSTLEGESLYENVSEYVRDLIRKDRDRLNKEAFEKVKAELRLAFAQPNEYYEEVTAADIISRNAPQ